MNHHQHSSPQKPLVVLLDLDGTLAGRVTSVLCEYEIHRTVVAAASSNNNAAKRGGPNNGVPKQIRDSIVSRLRYGIIRPHVIDFCRGVAEMGSGIELFVFTASENNWANFFVPCVEAALGVRFNRPIFTRNHCVMKQSPSTSSYPPPNIPNIPNIPSSTKRHPPAVVYGGVSVLKSISKLRPLIFRSLRNRYPGLGSGGPNGLVDRVILVDNTPHVMADPRESSKLVVCPTYDYAYIYDVLAHLPVDVLHSEFLRLIPMLQRNGMFPTGAWLSLPGSRPASMASSSVPIKRVDTYSSFAAVYYRRLARLLDASAEPNNVALLGNPRAKHSKGGGGGDRFFLDLLNAMRSLVARRFSEDCFDDAGVAELSAKRIMPLRSR